ncbi:hypothetical protein FOVSG1_009940 [Fusarium oxysporum f. sp. vasinfectum]
MSSLHFLANNDPSDEEDFIIQEQESSPLAAGEHKLRLFRAYILTMRQVSLSNLDDGLPRDMFKSIESAGMNAIVLTVDSAGDRTAYRPLRRLKDTSISRDPRYTLMTWDYYTELQSATSLPIMPKGIRTVEDAREAIEVGAPAISLSSHGGRSLDGLPSALEVAWEIHQRDLSIFEEIKVYADGGVRYGTDVLKLLALAGISQAMSLLTNEITSAGANLGLASIKDINATYLELPITACNS